MSIISPEQLAAGRALVTEKAMPDICVVMKSVASSAPPEQAISNGRGGVRAVSVPTVASRAYTDGKTYPCRLQVPILRQGQGETAQGDRVTERNNAFVILPFDAVVDDSDRLRVTTRLHPDTPRSFDVLQVGEVSDQTSLRVIVQESK